MCGLFGFVLKTSVPQEIRQRIITLLAYEMDHRGGDSFGYWDDVTKQVTRGLGHSTYKINPALLKRSKLVLAHTRYGTTGAVTIPNAHPFEIGDIIGAHNGIVHNYTALNTKYNRTFEVDSMHIFAHLNEKKPLKEVDAYGAITFINKKDLKKVTNHVPVFLGKFNHGQLCIAGFGKVENPEGIIWCSDETDLKRILNYTEKEFFIYKVEHDCLYEIEDFNLLKLSVKLNFGKETRIFTSNSTNYCGVNRSVNNIHNSAYTNYTTSGVWNDDEDSCYMCSKALYTPCGTCGACVSCCLCSIAVRNLDENSSEATKLLLLKKLEDATSDEVQTYDIVENNESNTNEILETLPIIDNSSEVLDYSEVFCRELNQKEKEKLMEMKLD